MKGRRDEPWSAARYAHAPQVRSASARARIEALLARRWARLGPEVEAAALETVVDANTGTWTSEETRLRREGVPAARAADVLARAASEAQASERAIAQARDHWAGCARVDVRAWMAGVAGDAEWERTRRAVREVTARLSGGLSLRRWALLARGGGALARKIRTCDPWLAGEVCKHIEGEALAGNERAWRRAVVRHHAQGQGRAAGLSDADADAALAHWRWPNVRPPLSVVAAGAGVLEPIRTDGGWANALGADVCLGGVTSEVAPEAWARDKRAREEETITQTIAAMESAAQAWAERRWPTLWADRIERWAQAWGANPRLAGDGHAIAPVLAERTTITGLLGWTIPIEGPKMLIARCELDDLQGGGREWRWGRAVRALVDARGAPTHCRVTLGNTVDERRDDWQGATAAETAALGAPIAEMSEQFERW